MEKTRTKKTIKKGIRFGVFNITDSFIETHHRTLTAAARQCKKRQGHWGKEKEFKVTEVFE